MTRAVLIVTHRRGFEADPVIDALRQLGVAVFRYNADVDSWESSISITLSSRERGILLSCDGRSFSASDIAAAWFQQPFPDLEKKSEGALLRYESHRVGWLGMCGLLRCPWLNHPQAAHSAANKILQLNAALDAELPIPETLISNIPTDVRLFLSQENVIAKNLATPWYKSASKTLAAYTIGVDITLRDDDISFAPVIYQQFIVRQRDYRVVVVGQEIFAVSCEDVTGSKRLDSRRGELNPSNYARAILPHETCHKLLRLLELLGLNYCSADFIEDRDGQLLFLDLNATGAWWWVDMVFEGAVCRAITQFLVNAAKL
jgi:hypothetical protein